MEDLAAAGKALVAQAFADFFCKRGPVAAGRLIALASIVHHQCTIKGILHGRLFFQQFLEDPAIAQHTGQAGHHALSCALAVFGGFDHRVHIGTGLRPQRQALDAFIGQSKVLEIVQAGCILALIHEGKQGIVGADGLHILCLGHAPGKHLGIFPQVKTVLHDVALEAGFIQCAIRKVGQKF